MKSWNTKIFLFAWIMLPALAQAATIAPGSKGGIALVHKMAEEASRTFVSQSDLLNEKDMSDNGQKAIELGCDSRAKILEDFSQLDLKGSEGLASAKKALEKISCVDGATTLSEAQKNYDHIYTATLFLRSSDSLE